LTPLFFFLFHFPPSLSFHHNHSPDGELNHPISPSPIPHLFSSSTPHLHTPQAPLLSALASASTSLRRAALSHIPSLVGRARLPEPRFIACRLSPAFGRTIHPNWPCPPPAAKGMCLLPRHRPRCHGSPFLFLYLALASFSAQIKYCRQKDRWSLGGTCYCFAKSRLHFFVPARWRNS
jgi:hypothetical protein